MSKQGKARIFRQWVPILALTVGVAVCVPLLAGNSEIENEKLALILRQLDTLERAAQQSAAAAETGPDTRYHFDYARLRADIAQIRTGIEDYLTPRRAQPRDPDTLNGLYRRDGNASR